MNSRNTLRFRAWPWQNYSGLPHRPSKSTFIYYLYYNLNFKFEFINGESSSKLYFY